MSESSVEMKPNKTSLMDINFDCLVHIFEKLSLTNLLNHVDFNKLQDQAAALAFSSRHKKKLVTLQGIGLNRIERICESEDEIVMKDLRVCLQFLRCFGHLITKLNVSYFE